MALTSAAEGAKEFFGGDSAEKHGGDFFGDKVQTALVAFGGEAVDAGEVDDAGAVDGEEGFWRKQKAPFAQSAVVEVVGAVSGSDSAVGAVGFDENNFTDWVEAVRGGVFEEELRAEGEKAGGFLRLGADCGKTRERSGEVFLGNGFQDVIERCDFKAFECVLRVRGGEDDVWSPIERVE